MAEVRATAKAVPLRGLRHPGSAVALVSQNRMGVLPLISVVAKESKKKSDTSTQNPCGLEDQAGAIQARNTNQLRLASIDIKGFKSYRDQAQIGPLSSFTCIVRADKAC